MRACATVQLVRAGMPAVEAELGHGDLIGRLSTAALQIDDLRVSEAHAMVSLRSGSLRLLALRRRFEVDRKPAGEVELFAGLQIVLAPEVTLRIGAVRLPDAVMGLRWAGGEAALLHDVAAIVAEPEPAVVWRPVPHAHVQLWRMGDTWRYVHGDAPPADLQVGDRLSVGSVEFEAALIPLQTGDATRGPGQPLRIVAFYDTVHILRDRHPPFVIAGGGARLISELALAGVPIGWAPLARTLWTDDEPDHVLRGRLDAVLRRLRSKLASGGIRDDLVAADGLGHVELRLDSSDSIEDRT
ncbi:MAG: hypothetical protein R3F61_32355 [Myxococcota bacterium]